MKNTIFENGVYIYANEKLNKPEEFTGKDGSVVLVFGSEAFVIHKEYSDKMTWADAKKYCETLFADPPTIWQRPLMQRYEEEINKALDNIGGEPIGWVDEWLEEDSPANGWNYDSDGVMNYIRKDFPFARVRPISTFDFDLVL